jgi:cholesterol oxidase
MTGCRHNAKNTLPKNYLALAEAAGARIVPLTTVTGIDPLAEGGYRVEASLTGSRARAKRRTLTADHVVVAAGTYSTQKLLHRMRDEGRLPGLSSRLGHLTRTNSEALLGAVRTMTPADFEEDFSEGVAITSSFYPQPDTHIEPVRYGHGSNAMGLLQSLLVPQRTGVPQWRTWLRESLGQPLAAARMLDVRRWSERSIIALVMQAVDNSITLSGARGRTGRWRLTSRDGDGEKAPSYIAVGHDVVRRMAEVMQGRPAGSVLENLGLAVTAHFVGGCVVGESAETGVIDAYHRVFGHPGLHVVDGSAITANLGVNPSLTITAQAERAMALWPNKGEDDPRPEPGHAYLPVAPVAPRRPLVPEAAPGALRLPLV